MQKRAKKKNHFHQKICSFLSNHWYICLKMALKLKFWWNFLITLNLAFWGNHANFWNYTFFQYQSTMLGFLCTVFPFGRKRNKPMCYIITLLPTEEMYKISIKYHYIWPQKRIQILLANFFSLRTFYLYLYCKAVCRCQSNSFFLPL